MLRTPQPNPRRQLRRRWLTASCATACLLSPTSASAFSFNEQGELSFDPQAIFTESFENFQSTPGTTVIQGDALEGQKFVQVSSYALQDSQTISLSVGSSNTAYRVRAFVRGTTSWYPLILIQYMMGPGPLLTFATMSPTGRMTSDGWIEIESAPISIDGDRYPYAGLMMTSEKIDLDALEVVPAPGDYLPSTPCAGVNSCGPQQVCVDGACQSGDSMVPSLPGDAHRDLVVDLLQRKIQISFGGVRTRQEPMQQALATMESMRTATTPWAFWNTFAKAVSQLQDSHTLAIGVPSYSGAYGKAFPICFVEGSADSSHALVPAHPEYADVLVSHVGPYDNLGIKAGDRLVSVDGMHPIAWMKNFPDFPWLTPKESDPEAHGITVESLQTAIRALASTVQVIRCSPASCSPPETIDLANLPDGMMTEHPVCDHRPSFHLAKGNPDPVLHNFEGVYHGELADSAPGEDLYGMIWNDTMWYDGPNPWQQAYDTFRTKAKGLVLDHRRGDGGTAMGSAYLTELSRYPTTVAVWSTIGTLGLFDSPYSQDDGLAFFDLLKNDDSRAFVVGSTTPREDMRIAVLLARDMSGSDFFPFGVKGAPNTKLFGRQTSGAFSTFHVLEAQGFFYWSLASGDFVGPDGVPHLGHGVVPDEVIVPKQSDLLAGKDTVYERALAWVRCGEEVCP